MANWVRRLELKDVWGSKDISLIARTLSVRLLALAPYADEWVEDKRIYLACDFESLSKDTTADAEDFDCIMEELYDWADTPLDDKPFGAKVCWVSTF
jgi:hypothetical protein